jgi:putative sugar O-methyltransferase
MNLNESDYQDYCNVCIQASRDDAIFNDFKRIPAYNHILEHTSKEQGEEYLKQIQHQFGENQLIWDDLLYNDTFGNPTRSTFVINNKQVKISPSTLRYIHYGIEFLKFVKSTNITTPNIIEIGGGYGGQSFIISKLAPMFGVDIKAYVILDLSQPKALITKYLHKIKAPEFIKAYTLDDVSVTQNKNNVLISNYAFAEFHPTIRQLYIDNVLQKTQAGYMVWNSPDDFDPFFKTMKIETSEEIPLTFHFNKIIKYRKEGNDD